MSYVPKISVIIPTYNRSKYLTKIVEILVCSKIPNEIIICDSRSKDKTFEIINNIKFRFRKHIIKYFNVNKNSNSIKRNVGIKESISKYLVFLDDDCIPQDNFLEDYYFILEKYKHKNLIFCGTVNFPKIKKNNFISYRDSRHFKIDRTKKIGIQNLHPRKIVTMNMGLKKNILISNKIFFSEKFGKYGFEDYEFGFRLQKNLIKIVPCCPNVCHYDLRDLEKYLNKFKFVGYESSKLLKEINVQASLENNYVKLENYFIIKLISKFKLCLKLLIFFERKMIILEKKVHLPDYLYKFLTINSYLIGYFSFRQDIKIYNKIKKWYL